MDILDQLSSQPSSKLKKNKTSIQLTTHDSLARSIMLDAPNHSYTPATPTTSTRKSIPSTSQPNLKLNSFDSSSFVNTRGNIESNRDMGGRDREYVNPNAKISMFSALPGSLGVIYSEENSEDSSPDIQSRTNLRRRSSQVNAESVPMPIREDWHTEELEELRAKVKSGGQKREALEAELKEVKKTLADRDAEMKGLQDKVQSLHEKNHTIRKEVMEEQSKLFNTEIEKISRAHQQQLRRRQQLLKWQHQNKTNVLQTEIQSLKMIIQRYNTLLQTSSKISVEKHRLEVKNQRDSHDYNYEREKLQQKERDLEGRSRELDKKMGEFYEERREMDRKMDKVKREAEEATLRNKEQMLKIRREFEDRQCKLAQEYQQKQRKLREKQKKLELQKQQVQLFKQLLQKEKEQNNRINQKLRRQHKLAVQDLAEQKQRAYQHETDLLKKIQVVEMYSKSAKNNLVITRPQSAECKVNVLPAERENVESPKIEQAAKTNSSTFYDKKLNGSAVRKGNLHQTGFSLQKSASTSKLLNKPIFKLYQFMK